MEGRIKIRTKAEIHKKQKELLIREDYLQQKFIKELEGNHELGVIETLSKELRSCEDILMTLSWALGFDTYI